MKQTYPKKKSKNPREQNLQNLVGEQIKVGEFLFLQRNKSLFKQFIFFVKDILKINFPCGLTLFHFHITKFQRSITVCDLKFSFP